MTPPLHTKKHKNQRLEERKLKPNFQFQFRLRFNGSQINYFELWLQQNRNSFSSRIFVPISLQELRFGRTSVVRFSPSVTGMLKLNSFLNKRLPEGYFLVVIFLFAGTVPANYHLLFLMEGNGCLRYITDSCLILRGYSIVC